MRTATATAPGRVNLIGEHTDYNGGLCLPIAIDLATTARLTTRPDDRVHLRSPETGSWSGTLTQIAAGEAQGWARYVAGVLWACAEAGWDVPGLDIDVTTTLPVGGGLSSSAALECAVATALAGLLDSELDTEARLRIAEICRRAETTYVGAPTGGMDQLASMCGVGDQALLIDFTERSRPTLSAVPFALSADAMVLLVTDTQVRHRLADGDGGYAQRRRECEAGDLRRWRHVANENDRVRAAVEAAGARDWPRLGDLMNASHASLRDDFEVSTDELDLAASAAVLHGAFGARLTGGGFGGCTISLMPEGRVDAVRKGIDAAFAAALHRAPVHRTVRAVDGARLVT